jgi:hypothetical protein
MFDPDPARACMIHANRRGSGTRWRKAYPATVVNREEITDIESCGI